MDTVITPQSEVEICLKDMNEITQKITLMGIAYFSDKKIPTDKEIYSFIGKMIKAFQNENIFGNVVFDYLRWQTEQ